MRLTESVKRRYNNSILGILFSGKTDGAKGRRCMLASSLLSSAIANITGGIFYSGFLVGYGINIVNIGIISFVPTLATLLSLFSPFILDRIAKRKWVLAGARIFYYALTLLGILVIPHIFEENLSRVLAITILMSFAAGVNALFGQGYSAWHMNFLPDSIRGDYLLTNSCIAAFTSGLFALVVAVVTDSLAGSPRQLEIIILLRIIAFALAVLDVLVLLLPKEYEYKQTTEKPRLRNVFTIPLKNKKFSLTILMCVIWYLFSNCHAAVINTWLLQDMEISYTLITFINFTYFFFFLFFSKMWRKFINKLGWIKALSFSAVITGVTYITYSFLTKNNSFTITIFGSVVAVNVFFFIVRHMQHVTGIVTNLCMGNMPYINTPDSDRVSYFSFYAVAVNITSFISQLLGTGFVSIMKDRALTIFGHDFTALPILLMITGAGQILTGIIVFILTPKLTPDQRY
ncbi:MAG: hypothetical protein J5940_06600 [Clostridia bacterium]|nr:hypothetical protein [Clostridia bacterium]